MQRCSIIKRTKPFTHSFKQLRHTQAYISLQAYSSQWRATSTSASRRVVFSGIQPTGVPHLGNYLGALRPWVNLQNSEPATTKLVFSIVDLHALTVSPNVVHLRQWKKETLAMLLAIGLNPERCTIYFQSDVFNMLVNPFYDTLSDVALASRAC